jgi:hypothetical protein
MAYDSKKLWDELNQEIQTKIPTFQVAYKPESWLMRLIGKVMEPINPNFQNGFITTIYPKVYFPNRESVANNPESYAGVLAHEFVHLCDADAHKAWFSISYLLPQLLFLPALLLLSIFASWIPVVGLVGGLIAAYASSFILPSKARPMCIGMMSGIAVLLYLTLAVIFSHWWAILFGLALVPLAPWRAYWRAGAEYRGYVMSLAWEYWMYGDVSDDWITYHSQYFTGFDYYRMDGNKDRVINTLTLAREKLKTGKFFTEPMWESMGPYAIVYSFLKKRGTTNG